MPKPQIKCPAAEEQHPVTSPNPLDVECRIQGNLRPARSSGVRREVVVCCGDYATCPVWKAHKRVEIHNSSIHARRQSRDKRSKHTPTDHTREKVVVN